MIDGVGRVEGGKEVEVAESPGVVGAVALSRGRTNRDHSSSETPRELVWSVPSPIGRGAEGWTGGSSMWVEQTEVRTIDSNPGDEVIDMWSGGRIRV